MTEPQQIDALPEWLIPGKPLASRPGSQCRHARRKDTGERYIIKTIRVPSSGTQLDALLLSGAYPDAKSAAEYFRTLAEDMAGEARILNKLTAQRGFFDFTDTRITPLEADTGYALTLTAPYRRSLEELFGSRPLSRRGAVNMAIDLCAALALCREAGYLYVDLKPSNVFLSSEGDFRIGDLGFEKLTGLKYAVLPDRCRSAWTPPEIRDAYSTLNTTMDTYALGLMLYQAFNGGKLLWKDEAGRRAMMTQLAGGGLMTAPADGDFELTRIIQRACAHDPAQRWQTPVQMAQALIEYLKTLPEETAEPIPPEEDDWMARMDAILGEDTREPQPSLGDLPLPEEVPEPAPAREPEPKKRGYGRWLAAAVAAVLLAAGLWFGYQEFILQNIEDLSVTGQADSLTVSVVTDMDESRLSVICVDQYGLRMTSGLEEGQAVFTGLMPDTQYTLSLEAEGLCVLTGQLSTKYYTPMETTVLDFTAATGPEDGSVLLTFDTDGPDSDSWTLTWAAEGGQPQSASFGGHMHTVTGLTPGVEYTFTLSAGEGLQLAGTRELTFTARSLVYAQHLTLAGNQDGSITASWTAPADVTVAAWTARCYNDVFDQTLIVTGPTATFTGIDPQASYTIEVVAEGMTQCTRTYVTANPITITDVQAEPFGEDSLIVTWAWEGSAPAGGWLLLYTLDQGSEQHVIRCPGASAVISPVVPGSHYDLTIQAAGAVSVFGGTGSVDVPEAQVFDYFDMDASAVTMALAKVPGDGWTWESIGEGDYTTTFDSGEPIALLLTTQQELGGSDSAVTTMFVFRGEDGRVARIGEVTMTWDEMWTDGHCGLTISDTPQTPGQYTLQVYVDGKLLSNQDVTFR